jgi:hypothetical protein
VRASSGTAGAITESLGGFTLEVPSWYYGLGPYLGGTYPAGPLQPYVSPPPRPFVDLPPQPFVVVPEYHQFRDAQLPRVSTERPQVLIRTFDPELGVYRDTEVRDGEGEEESCDGYPCAD